MGYQNQHRPDVERHLDEVHPDAEHRPDLDERQRRLDVEHHLDVDRGPCPG